MTLMALLMACRRSSSGQWNLSHRPQGPLRPPGFPSATHSQPVSRHRRRSWPCPPRPSPNRRRHEPATGRPTAAPPGPWHGRRPGPRLPGLQHWSARHQDHRCEKLQPRIRRVPPFAVAIARYELRSQILPRCSSIFPTSGLHQCPGMVRRRYRSACCSVGCPSTVLNRVRVGGKIALYGRNRTGFRRGARHRWPPRSTTIDARQRSPRGAGSDDRQAIDTGPNAKRSGIWTR